MFPHSKWDEIEVEQISAFQTRQVLHTSHMSVVRLVSKKGAVVPLHHHVHEQVTFLMSGHFRFDVGGERVDLQAGGFLTVPSNLPHSAEALADSVTFEVFCPPRQDWLKKDAR